MATLGVMPLHIHTFLPPFPPRGRSHIGRMVPGVVPRLPPPPRGVSWGGFPWGWVELGLKKSGGEPALVSVDLFTVLS